MATQEEVKTELKKLIDGQSKLLELAKETGTTIEFGTEYQKWYSRAYKVVEALAPERVSEFSSYYLIDPKRKQLHAGSYSIQDYVKGIGAPTDYIDRPTFDIHNAVMIRVLNQVQIIASLSSRIDSVLQDVTGQLFAELQDAELTAATKLKKISLRAAGALAGVVLERHLQRTAQNHKITIRKKTPTIADLNDPLKKAGVYDVTTWRKIQLLGDIRNLCSHEKGKEPTNDQVDDLITGVNGIIKSVF